MFLLLGVDFGHVKRMLRPAGCSKKSERDVIVRSGIWRQIRGTLWDFLGPPINLYKFTETALVCELGRGACCEVVVVAGGFKRVTSHQVAACKPLANKTGMPNAQEYGLAHLGLPKSTDLPI